MYEYFVLRTYSLTIITIYRMNTTCKQPFSGSENFNYLTCKDASTLKERHLTLTETMNGEHFILWFNLSLAV